MSIENFRIIKKLMHIAQKADAFGAQMCAAPQYVAESSWALPSGAREFEGEALI